jgi:hypothetical protein
MAQLEMFNEAPSVSAAPSADVVRSRLESIFATLRSDDKPSWNELRRLKLVVPQMAQWLPEAERARAVAEFDQLVPADRTEAAA